MKQIIKTIAVLLCMVSLGFSTYAYDVKFGNYYFNRISTTSVDNVGYVTTFHYNVEATSKEGGYSTFTQTYSGAIAPPATFTVTETEGSSTIAYAINVDGNFYKTTNAGATWTLKTTNYSLTTSKDGYLLGVSSANPNLV